MSAMRMSTMIQLAAEIAADAAVDHAEEEIDEGCGKAHGKGDSRTVHEAHEDVAPELVGAERMLLTAGRVVSQRQVLPVIGVGGEQGHQDGKRRPSTQKKAQADEGELVFLESEPRHPENRSWTARR